MKKISIFTVTPILILFILLGNKLEAQIDTFHHDIVTFTVDDIDQLYYVDSNGSVFKHQIQNDSIKYYNNIMMGAPYLLSAKSANRLYLYYKDFSSIIVLDNYLAPQSRINLIDLDLSMVDCMTASADGGIWVFDILNNELVKLDSRGQINYRSGDMRNQIEENLFPTSMTEYDEEVYLVQGDYIYVFDRFANYQRSIHHPGLTYVTPIKGGYVILDDAGLSYHSEAPPRDFPLSINLNTDSTLNFSSALSHIYFLQENGDLLQFQLKDLGIQ